MRLCVPAIAAAVLLVASPARTQESRRFGLEAGVVMGIIAVPYPTVAVVAAPWSVRVSGGRAPGVADCDGLQVNLGRVLREKGNAKHTVGAVWAHFRDGCWTDNPYTSGRNRESGGNYGIYNSGGSGAAGAYQFMPGTWNSTAASSGRGDLVGVDPAQASPADQDAMAQALYAQQGAAPWGGGC